MEYGTATPALEAPATVTAAAEGVVTTAPASVLQHQGTVPPSSMVELLAAAETASSKNTPAAEQLQVAGAAPSAQKQPVAEMQVQAQQQQVAPLPAPPAAAPKARGRGRPRKAASPGASEPVIASVQEVAQVGGWACVSHRCIRARVR